MFGDVDGRREWKGRGKGEHMSHPGALSHSHWAVIIPGGVVSVPGESVWEYVLLVLWMDMCRSVLGWRQSGQADMKVPPKVSVVLLLVV